MGKAPGYQPSLSASHRDTKLYPCMRHRKMNDTTTLIYKKWLKISLIDSRSHLVISHLYTSLKTKKASCWTRFCSWLYQSVPILGTSCRLSGSVSSLVKWMEKTFSDGPSAQAFYDSISCYIIWHYFHSLHSPSPLIYCWRASKYNELWA